MDRPNSPLPAWVLWAVMILLMALALHLVVEISVQVYFARHSGVANYLAEFREKARQAGLDLEQYGRRLKLDPYLGWGLEEVRVHESQSPPEKTKTIVFVGDSVTAGHDVEAGREDYPSLLAERWAGRGSRVVNLAARGYGVDQMWLKTLTMAGGYRPDLLVFAYIPHDLLRPASDFNFGLPKPRFRFDGSKPELVLAQSVRDFQGDYESARSHFYLSEWFAGRYWANREYYLPGLMQGYFRRLYGHIGAGLARLAETWGVPVVVVKLTNFRSFKGVEQLVTLAKSQWVQAGSDGKSEVSYLDTDACVMAKAKGIDLKQEFAHHPGPAGHRLLADCVGEYLEPLVWGRRP